MVIGEGGKKKMSPPQYDPSNASLISSPSFFPPSPSITDLMARVETWDSEKFTEAEDGLDPPTMARACEEWDIWRPTSSGTLRWTL